MLETAEDTFFEKGRSFSEQKTMLLKDLPFGIRQRGGRNTFSHVLTRAIGVQPHHVTPDVTIHGIAPGDTILLCSDGLSDVITDEEIMVVLTDRSISDAAERLVMMAKEKRSDDNISVIISRVVDVPVLENSRFTNIKTA